MEADLPFQPLDAYRSLQALLPSFAFDIPESDLRQFVIHGFVSRRYVLRGRFKGFGHTRIMRLSADLAVESFLDDPIPKDDPHPLYNGDAAGFVIEGGSRVYTRRDDLWLTNIPNDERLAFVYQRPSIIQSFTLALDLFFNTIYEDTLKTASSVDSEHKPEIRTSMTIFQFLHISSARLLFLEESFQEAVNQQSRFGFSEALLRAMSGRSLISRISEKYDDAERVLLNALSLASDNDDLRLELESGLMLLEVESELLLDLGGLYLDQKKSDDAEKQFLKVLQRLQQLPPAAQLSLRVKGLEGLVAVHFQNRSLKAAETLLGQVIHHWNSHGGTECIEYLAAENILGVIRRAQGELRSAALICTKTLSCQEERVGSIHHESLRTMHNLAGILADEGQFSEAEVLYLREIHGLEKTLGPENTDTLRTVSLLARTYYAADKVENAVDRWKQVTEVSRRTRGLEDMSTMENTFQLAKSLGRMREYHEAVKLLAALLPYNIKILGREHPMSRRTKLLLVNLSRRQENPLGVSSLKEELFDETRVTHSHVVKEDGLGAKDTSISLKVTSLKTHGDDDRINIMLGQREKGTCDWIFDHHSYKAWSTSYSSSLLWLAGGPGTGKTMLAAAVVADLQKNQDAVIHYFFDSRDAKVSNVAGLLSSLVAQMKQIKPGLPKDGLQMPQQSYNPIATLFDEFSEIATGFEELYCCIDAIDEAGGWKVTLLRGIFDLVRSETSPIRFFLTSRSPLSVLPSPEVASTIQLPNNETIQDTKKIINSTLRALRQQGKTIRGDQIESRLEEVADGSFLWAKLALAIIGRTGEYNDEFPKSLHQQYYRSLQSQASELGDSGKELLVLVLYWLTMCLRPLTVRELQIAIAIEPFKQSLDEMRLLFNPTESIVKLGGPLVRIREDDTIVLVHQSLKKYLISSQAPLLRISSQIAIPISPTEGNALVTSICLTYLSFSFFDSPYSSESTTDYSLLQYAACHWYLHAAQTGKQLSVLRSVAKFIYSQHGFNWLDGLQSIFNKSVEDLLVIQSNIAQWARNFGQTNLPHVDNFILTLYRRKFKELRSTFPDSRERLKFLLKFADICQATGHMNQAEKLYKEVLGNTSPTFPEDLHLQIKGRATSINEEQRTDQNELKPNLVHDPDVNFELRYPLSLSSKANLAIVYQNQGKWKEAEDLNREVIKLSRKILGSEHPDTLTSMSNLSSIYRDQGRWIEAEHLEAEVIEMKSRVLGPEHPLTLVSMSNLAIVLSSQGKYEEAERIHQNTLELRKTILGGKHPNTLTSMNNLALVLSSQGKYAEAERIDRQVRGLRELVLGSEHPDTLTTMNNLAIMLSNQGKYEEAEPLHREVLGLREKVLGREHPHTLMSMENLAMVLSGRRKYDEAEQMYRLVLPLMEEVFGTKHPSTLLILTNLGNNYRDQGKPAEAKTMYLRALSRKEKAWGFEHTSTLDTVKSLGKLYASQGEMVEAEDMYQRALNGYEKAWGLEHTSTLDTVKSLGRVYAGQGKMAEAEDMYQRALNGYEKAWGLEHTSTLNTVKSLGRVYAGQGKMAEAEDMYQRALNGYEKAWGLEHTSTLDTVKSLGRVYADQGKMAEAEDMYQRALNGYEKAWGLEHTSALDTVKSLGKLYADHGKMAEAEKMYQRALNGFEKVWGPEHIFTLDTVKSLGMLYADQGKMAEAEDMYQRALNGLEKAWGLEHTFTLDTVKSLGKLYADHGKMAEAEKMYQRALNGFEKVWGPEHIFTLDTVKSLGMLYADQDKMAEAEKIFQRALNEYEKPYGNALQAASSRGHDSTVQMLLEIGADVNSQDGKYGNALQAASCEGHLSTVQILLDHGADVNSQGGKYGNALQAASCEGHLSTVKILLDHGADVNSQGGKYGNALQAASCEGHLSTVKRLLDYGADVNSQGGKYGNALQAASCEGHDSTVKILLDYGADVNSQGGKYGNALQAASCEGHLSTVKILLDYGADVDAQGGEYGNALQAASSGGHDSTVQILLEQGADVNAQGGKYGNALQAASCEGHLSTVKILLDYGADVDAQGGEYGNALQAASSGGHDSTVQILLEQGADVNAQGGKYGNALQAASSGGHDSTVQMLDGY